MNNGQIKRQYFLDNLKVFLTCLVMFHHIVIAYGGEGLFIIKAPTSPSVIGGAGLTAILAINQSYFMGLFFLISAYFSYSSLQRKGKKEFIIGKVKRLLIPTVTYYFAIAPLTHAITDMFYNGLSFSELSYVPNIGPLWFLLALFTFDVIYALVRDKIKYINKLPNKSTTAFVLIGVGIVTWLVRIAFPVGVGLPVAGYQLAHFPQYIFAYSLGITISKNNWLESIKKDTTKILLWLIPMLLGFFGGVALVFMIFKSVDLTMGGLNIVAFLYAVWEQFMFIIMSIGLLAVFKNRYQSKDNEFVLKYMSGNAFHAYVIHFLVIVIVVIGLSLFNLNHYVSMLLATVLSISFSFLLSGLIKRIPGF